MDLTTWARKYFGGSQQIDDAVAANPIQLTGGTHLYLIRPIEAGVNVFLPDDIKFYAGGTSFVVWNGGFSGHSITINASPDSETPGVDQFSLPDDRVIEIWLIGPDIAMGATEQSVSPFQWWEGPGRWAFGPVWRPQQG